MKEIPFQQHHPLLPLPSNKEGDGQIGGINKGGSGGGSIKTKRVVVSIKNTHDASNNDDDDNTLIGLHLSEEIIINNSNNDALVPVVQNNDGTAATTNTNNFDTQQDREESYAHKRALTSLHYSSMDDCFITTRSNPYNNGIIHISIRNSGGSGGKSSSLDEKKCCDLQVDITSILQTKVNGSSLFDSTIVGTSVHVDNNSNLLHFKLVDTYGTLLLLSLDYPTLSIPKMQTSFLVPFTIKGGNHHAALNPHPGSTIENNQVCFPTADTVVFALNPHLYCVDLGLLYYDGSSSTNNDAQEEEGRESNGGGGTRGSSSSSSRPKVVKTRVWTNLHHVTSDPTTDNSPPSPSGGVSSSNGTMATSTPRKKKQRKTKGLVSTITKATYSLMGMGDYENEADYEYADDDDDDDQEGVNNIVGSIPSIAALTNLSPSSSNDDDSGGGVAKVATLHSDGSLRIWTAEPSSKSESTRRRLLRIPSVQRIAISQQENDTSSSWTTSSSSARYYVDPPIPPPSTWDPCRDALTIRGRYMYDSSSEMYKYELALYVQVYSSTVGQKLNNNVKDDDNDTFLDMFCNGYGTSSLYVFTGDIVKGSSRMDDETRALPSGDTANMQCLALPSGTTSVVDVSWSSSAEKENELLVLLRYNLTISENEAETFYDIGEVRDRGKVILAMYPCSSGGKKGGYSIHPIVPSNMALPYLDFNHFGYAFGPSVDEEFDRYMNLSRDESDGNGEESDDDMEAGDDDSPSSSTATKSSSSASKIAKAEAKVDRAGLLAILQPFGRCRPSSLAVHRAMSTLNLLDDGETALGDIRPVSILSAMRKWKKRSTFQSTSFTTSSALVAVDNENEEENSPATPSGDALSIYHAFASATKSSAKKRSPHFDIIDDDGGNNHATLGRNAVEAAQQSHRLKWIRLLSEIRRQEAHLDEILCLSTSPCTNLVVRGSMISVLTIDDGLAVSATTALPEQEREMMAGLDELSVDLMSCISSDPELRQVLSKVESILYESASKASSVVEGWHDKSYVELLSQVEQLGSSALMKLSLTNKQIQLLEELSQPHSNLTETWQRSPLSVSTSVSRKLAISKPFGPMPNSNDAVTSDQHRDAISAASSLISTRLESIRKLSLSRLILVFGSPQKAPLTIQHGALRSSLYCTALSWAIHQQSSTNSSGQSCGTVLGDHLSQELTKEFYHSGMTAALPLADMFVASAFSFYESSFYANDNAPSDGILSNFTSPSHEPRVALRVLAPLVEYPAHSSSEINQKRREEIAQCLLEEAATVAKLVDSDDGSTSPEVLWRLASKLLLNTSVSESPDIIWNLMLRVETLESHLPQMEVSKTYLPLCANLVLEAIQDTISAITNYLPEGTSIESTEIPALWGVAFQTAMFGKLWDEALHACISNPLTVERKANIKLLILGMVNADALGKLMDMSLTVIEDGDKGSGVDLFVLASNIIEEAAVEQTTVSLGSNDGDVENALKDRPNFWGCLYALHASRGNWKKAAYAMDMRGKATADFVSSSKSNPDRPLVLSKAASKKVMNDACLSAQACFHAISLVEKPSQRYLLSGNEDIPSESRLLTQEDLERRATRAKALRTLALDEYSPDSVSSILESTSRDTIDSLAKFGYYDQAIAVASGVSSKRNGLPGGVDLFDDALKYILSTYLVPAATKKVTDNDNSGVVEKLQSRSKMAQIRAASSACALGADIQTARVNSSTANPISVDTLQPTMAMDLLQQYTTVYSGKCHGLVLHVANAILDVVSELPLWLKDLCIFGLPNEVQNTKDGLFAQPISTNKVNAGIADPTGLMRLYIKHHQYGEACDVVTSILSKTPSQSSSTTRLPEKGNIDYVPYDLIDMLWDMIDSIITSNSTSTDDDVKAKVKALIKKRSDMEQALEGHFVSTKTSEEGLQSARRLVSA